jgi:electron transport complex protein RnfB
MTPLAASILAVLPQTQCTRCGEPDCAAYAQSVALGQAAINQCPPGGREGIERLASLTGQAVQVLNPQHGLEAPRTVAFIDEDWCIGCTLCIKACPVDAIVGANKRMHTVIEAACTGCELCLPACPVDCIVLENVSGTATGWLAWSMDLAQQAQQRYAQHQMRLAREVSDRARGLKAKVSRKQGALAQTQAATAELGDEVLTKRAFIEAALERARAKRSKG